MTNSKKRIMMMIVIAFGFLLILSAQSISLNLSNVSVKSAMETLQKEYGYSFVFASGDVDTQKTISIRAQNVSIDEVIKQILQGQNEVEYEINNKNIIVRKKEKSAQNNEFQAQPGIRVTGTVSDDNGQLMPGVTISIRGTTTGTATDINGEFTIIVPNDTSVLQFRFLGYRMQEVVVGNRRIIAATMQETSTELGEVVVVAFGTQKKESIVASITTVNPSELKVPSSNLTTALAGKIAGVISYQRSGEPGADDAEFFVRGVTTFGYTKSPLILLDGLEVTSSDLSRMQPDDIASFSIMKDATAAALYGARGANGVILVTTKEGREGKAQISVRYETTISAPTRKIELADPITYMKLHNEAVTTRDPYGIQPQPYTQEKIDYTEMGLNPFAYPAVDWYDMLMKDQTLNHRLNMNISGGGNIARYYIAATYNRDNGNLKVDNRNNFNSNIQLNRFAIRSNMNVKITPTTEAVVRLYTTFDDYTGPMPGGTNVYNMIMRAPPVLFPAYYEPDVGNQNIGHIMFGNYDTGDYINPYAQMVRGYKNYTTSTVIGQFEASQKLDFLLKGLKIRGLYSSTRYAYFDVNRYYNPFYYAIGRYDRQTDSYMLTGLNPDGGTEYLNYNEGAKNITSNSYIEAAIDYAQTFNEVHEVGALLVYYQREQLNANAGTLQLSLPNRNTGVSGRVTYGYKSKYFVEGAFGYNGSERFSKDNRFGFFPSIGLGWTVSNETFYPDALSKIVPKIRLKMTHGLVGNDAIGRAEDRFFYLSEVNMNSARVYTTGSEFGYTRSGVAMVRYENPFITWETAAKTNAGLELNLLNWIDINVDVYQEKRRNILLARSNAPSTMGLQSIPQTNFGKAAGQGIDASVDMNTNITTDWWLTGRFNFTYAKSKFVTYDEPDYSETPWKSRVGQSLNQTFGYVAERLFVDDHDVKNSPAQSGDVLGGDIKYKDINYDNEINELDQVPIGYPTLPEIVYGFGISTGYKGFDLSCFFQGLARESFWIDVPRTGPFTNYVQNIAGRADNDYNVPNSRTQRALLKAYADDHWSEANRNIYALWPRLSDAVNSNNAATSTWFMQNGSFLRLKSLEVGYSLPEKLINRINLARVRVYFSGTNLLTFSQFKLWDPEMAGNGLGYPIQKVYNFGIQVSL